MPRGVTRGAGGVSIIRCFARSVGPPGCVSLGSPTAHARRGVLGDLEPSGGPLDLERRVFSTAGHPHHDPACLPIPTRTHGREAFPIPARGFGLTCADLPARMPTALERDESARRPTAVTPMEETDALSGLQVHRPRRLAVPAGDETPMGLLTCVGERPDVEFGAQPMNRWWMWGEDDHGHS
jgi:hypothetical protein